MNLFILCENIKLYGKLWFRLQLKYNAFISKIEILHFKALLLCPAAITGLNGAMQRLSSLCIGLFRPVIVNTLRHRLNGQYYLFDVLDKMSLKYVPEGLIDKHKPLPKSLVIYITDVHGLSAIISSSTLTQLSVLDMH